MIYQRNLERVCRSREQMVDQIRKTVLHEGTTDAGGQLLVPRDEVQNQEVEIEVDAQVVGEKGEVMEVANETLAPPTISPGQAPGKPAGHSTGEQQEEKPV